MDFLASHVPNARGGTQRVRVRRPTAGCPIDGRIARFPATWAVAHPQDVRIYCPNWNATNLALCVHYVGFRLQKAAVRPAVMTNRFWGCTESLLAISPANAFCEGGGEIYERRGPELCGELPYLPFAEAQFFLRPRSCID